MKQFRFVFNGKVVEIEANSSLEATKILETKYPDVGGVYSAERFDTRRNLWIDLDSNEPAPVQDVFDVIVSKEYRITGTIKIAAESADAASATVTKMINTWRNENALRTTDPCIEWNDDQDYVCDSFMVDDTQ